MKRWDTKRCYRCKKTKSRKEFFRNTSARSGLSGYCKPCSNEANREYWRKYPDKARAYCRLRYQRNKKKILAAHAEWRRRNAAWRKEYQRRWHQENYSKVKAWAKSPRGRWCAYRVTARSRTVPFAITVDDVAEIIRQPCLYCGGKSGGIDRKIPSLGYTKLNSAPCCWECNRAKMDLNVKQFLELCQRVITRRRIINAYA